METRLTYIDPPDPLRPVGPQATQSLLDEKKIPGLDEHQYREWTEYLFSAPEPLLVTVAETVFRHDYQHPRALGLFLTCAVPLAKLTARRLTYKNVPDLREELMYDGAFNNALDLFQTHQCLDDTSNAATFRQILYRNLKDGAFRAAFGRMENTHVRSLATKHHHTRRPRLDEQLIAKQILEKIANLEPSPDPCFNSIRNLLRCLILQIGPDDALRPCRDSRNRLRSIMIDFKPLMKEFRISRRTARYYLRLARVMLTKMFNQDGTLFTTGPR